MIDRNFLILELNNILHLLNGVEVKGEMNLNNQLLSIIKIKNIKNGLEEQEHADNNEHGKNI